ncbi:hypothetical protein [Streptosporangium sp. KLBMP 9127]|nr:hypothetical protein [Streptosporangium sp. KLBMP 9127]
MNANGQRLPTPAVPAPPALLGPPRRDPALMYVWEAVAGPDRKKSGVTGFRHQAMTDLFQAMCGMPDPGAAGTLRAAVLDTSTRRPAYIYSPVLMRISRDPATGGIRVEDGDPR